MTHTTEPRAVLQCCPFCSGTVQFRKALWPSDGNTDAIIHADPTDCGLVEFSTDTTDESVITAWNTRLREAATPPDRGEGADAGEELAKWREPTQIMMDCGLYHCSADMTWEDLYTAWQAMIDSAIRDGDPLQTAATLPKPPEQPSAVDAQDVEQREAEYRRGLEDAAKVAESYPETLTETMSLGASQYDIATAIRALATATKEG